VLPLTAGGERGGEVGETNLGCGDRGRARALEEIKMTISKALSGEWLCWSLPCQRRCKRNVPIG
jgi:hypothetical protein